MKIAKQAFIKETQDYAARFGLSSERFAELFETGFIYLT
jgi:hypothetical protein